jgi:hypothetical protein
MYTCADPDSLEVRGSRLDLYIILSMARRSIPFAAILLCSTSSPAWQSDNNMNPVNSKSWSGVIINSGCTADEAYGEAHKCYEKRRPGAKLALYDDTIRHVFELDAQDQAARYFGEVVTVKGRLGEDNTIRGAAIQKVTSIGLTLGQKAPNFSARDQFGRSQTLDTVKGPNGTVLLFFRSADW